MKLKSPPPAPSSTTSTNAVSSASPFAPSPRAHPQIGFAAGTAERGGSHAPFSASFDSFVRKQIERAELAAVPSENATNVINGTVVAQTSIDGVRYVMVRCEPKPGEALLSLSPRERDIVNLIIKGYPNKMIADLLEISAWTVGTHLRRIFAKLGVTSRAAMVARYLHHLGE